MSEQDEHSALVALTEYQIRLLITMIQMYGPRVIPSVKGKELDKALNQLQIAQFALEQEKKRGR